MTLLVSSFTLQPDTVPQPVPCPVAEVQTLRSRRRDVLARSPMTWVQETVSVHKRELWCPGQSPFMVRLPSTFISEGGHFRALFSSLNCHANVSHLCKKMSPERAFLGVFYSLMITRMSSFLLTESTWCTRRRGPDGSRCAWADDPALDLEESACCPQAQAHIPSV